MQAAVIHIHVQNTCTSTPIHPCSSSLLLLIRTWQYDNSTAASAIALAFNAGFTHIDTALSYDNQVGVGQAVAHLIATGTPRNKIFLTTKTLPCTSSGRAA